MEPTACGRRLLVALALGGLNTLFALGCGASDQTTNAATPVSWSEIKRSLERPAGSYTRTMSYEVDGDSGVIRRDWLSYDLTRELVDHRLGIGDNPATPGIEAPPPRDDPSLRFVHLPEKYLMWNPGAEAKCGTPWVNMPRALVILTTGVDPSFVVEPKFVLLPPETTPQVVSNDENATVYEVAVDGLAGLPYTPAARAKKKVLGRLRKQRNVARVTAPHGSGPIEISVDVTHAMKLLSGSSASPGVITVTWQIEDRDPSLDVPHPDKVAHFSCMD